MTCDERIKISLLDSDKLVLDGLNVLFERENDIDVVGSSSNLDEGLEIIDNTQPDVIIIEPKVENSINSKACVQIRQKKPDAKIIALSSFFTQGFFLAARQTTITGLVLKRSPFDELAEAVRVVKQDDTYLCSEVRRLFADEYLNYVKNGNSNGSAHLTEKQLTVIELLASGKGTKEIAIQLDKSPKTIDACRRKIMDKLGLNSLAELVKYAIRMGLSEL